MESMGQGCAIGSHYQSLHNRKVTIVALGNINSETGILASYLARAAVLSSSLVRIAGATDQHSSRHLYGLIASH